MAMTSNNGPVGIASDINVTPLIDVLFVLLIVLMVIVPMVPKGLDATVPQPSKDDGNTCNTVVVSVQHGIGGKAEYKINQRVVPKDDLSARLIAIYANRAERVMFVKGDDEVNFSQVAEVIDMGRSAGVDHVGLITPKVENGL
jgi:biopolymer transport protein ExbD